MVKLYYLKSKIELLTILVIFFLFFRYNALCQTFSIPDNYIESPLIYSHQTNLKGISKILPIGDLFSKYSSLELSLVNYNIKQPSRWLKDRIYDELGNVAETERLLRSKDSPLSDPIFDQFKHLPIFIEDTIEQLALNPLVFCNKVNSQYNKTGKFYELNCTVPFGFFNNYILMRLQLEDNIWYFTKITTLNYDRLLELLTIADSFEIKKIN